MYFSIDTLDNTHRLYHHDYHDQMVDFDVQCAEGIICDDESPHLSGALQVP